MDSARAIPAVNALYATGTWLLDQDRARDAVFVFRAMLVGAPSDERGWIGLAATHEALGQPDVALELYDVGALAAKSARCLVGRARLLRAHDRNDEAAEAIENAAAFVDNTDEALCQLVAYELAVTHGGRAA